jgi:tetratricopeptide (TPR) repeat protein
VIDHSFSTNRCETNHADTSPASSVPDAGPEFLDQLSSLFQNDDEASIRAFLNSSQFRFHPSAFLKHPSPEVARAAAICLGLTGQLRHVDRLMELLHHDDFFVVNAAEKAVWSIWMRASAPNCVAWLSQAIDCIQAGYYEEAESLLDLILIEDPDFAEACNQRAIIHHLTGRYESSIMACHRTLSLNPNHHGAAAGLGHNLFHLGRFDEAIAAFRKALAIHPRMEGIRQAIRRCQLASAEDTYGQPR